MSPSQSTAALLRIGHKLGLALGGIGIALVVAIALAWPAAIEPWHTRWGATPDEVGRALPGDDVVRDPVFQSTRAITIHAPADAVWPWVAQIGQGRAGLYSYDWLENLFGCDIHSVDRIVPALQQPVAGDVVWLARGIFGEGGPRNWIRRVDPGRALVLGGEPGTGIYSHTFVVEPLDGSTTRLYARVRQSESLGFVNALHSMMERRMLPGIRERAEGRPFVPPVVLALAQAGWVLAGLGLLWALGTRPGWGRLWLLPPLAAALPGATFARDAWGALAAFLAVGTIIAGAVFLGRWWWAALLFVAPAVLAVLFTAPDAFAAFGLLFLLLLAGAPAVATTHPIALTERRISRMTLALLALALGSAAAALLGPLGLGAIEWRVSANALNQTYGADAAQLALVTPAALAASWLWSRGHRLAPPLSLGVGLATLYYAVASVLGADYLRYAGNNERFFLLFLALTVLSWTIAARAWAALDDPPPTPSDLLARGFGGLLVAGGALISLAWLAQLVDIARSGGLSSPADALAYAEAPSAFWTVRVVDLGFIAPACLAAGVGLWRRSATAIKAAYGLSSFFVLQAAAVLAMGFFMLWRRDPTATPGLVYALTPISLGLAVLTWRLLVSYARRPTTRQTPPAPLPATRQTPPAALARAA